MLKNERKNQLKNESKVSLQSVSKEEEERSPLPKSKIVNNNNSLVGKKGLKLEGGSVNERELPSIIDESSSFHKKKSHTNLQTLKLDDHLEKSKSKKLTKIMS